jgi:hypothetical protein
MKCQKKPKERRKGNLIPACPPETCETMHGRSSEIFCFRYSSIETHPLNYEYDSNPIRTTFTFFSFSRLPIETDLTMKDFENYLKCTEKYSQSQAF